MASTPNYNWSTPDNTGLVKNGALDIRTLGNAIDATMATMTPKSLVDAKGDLIAASANDTPARLAVGNNGETLVADSSTSTGLRYQGPKVQNGLYNSSFQIWQRGTSFTSANTYNADRYYKGIASANTVTRQLTNDTTNLPNIQYCLRSQRNSGSTVTAALEIVQNLETLDSIKFVGRTVTFSFFARKGADFSAAALAANIFSGTGTDQNILGSGYTGQATVASGSHTLTTTWQRFSITGTVATNAQEVCVYFNAPMSGTAGANDYFEITGLQLEVGSVATPYTSMTGTIQGELDACKRYCQNINYSLSGKNVYNTLANGSATGATSARITLPLPAPMRVAPTSVTFTASGFVLDSVAIAPTVTNVTINQGGTDTVLLTVDASAGTFTNKDPVIMYANNNSNANLILSAEL